MNLPDKVFLVGMPGSGKTTLGQRLASLTGKPFFDLDKEIERLEGKSIPEIFSTKGEDHFRKAEKHALKQVTQSENSFVLATGGGTPCFYDNMDEMLANGTVIYINVPVEGLVNRLKSGTIDRPKFRDAVDLFEEVKKLLELRKQFYKKAQLEVEGDQIQAEDILKTLENKS